MVLAVVALIVAALASVRIYLVRDDSGGLLLWNSSEAYLFVWVTHRGFSVSILQYPWIAVREYFYGSTEPDAERLSLDVVRVTPTDIQHSFLDGDRHFPRMFTPLNGVVFANCRQVLCKWAGHQFEEATPSEQKMIGGLDHLNPDVDATAGEWSKHGVGGGPAYSFTADVGGHFSIIETNKPVGHTAYSSYSLAVQRPGKEPEQIWQLNSAPRIVSSGEYKRASRK